MSQEKSKLRAELKQRRAELSATARSNASLAISLRLSAALDWAAVKSLHYFEPIAELQEVDISGLITDLEDNYPSLKLVTPRLVGGSWQQIAARGRVVPTHFEVIIVPCLGFDSARQRLGYGGGYYDKFLKSQANAKKIGVCFEDCRVKHIPAEPHDVPLDLVISEARTY